ncbi:MAG: LuxR C-terminal-related transcriptional regulator [Anaerolineae bacterium]|jgi:LuxR family maltose regulon positive regulatory protein|nr:LuxR C-terminal-related transcriptional regulator [Anaerolineae bacterium]
MAIPVLTTKLHVPLLRAGFVPRPRLLERLEAGCSSKLILVSAPAGFGKTTLVSTWARTRGHAVAWLALEGADNDPVRFWQYVIAALQTVYPEVGEGSGAALQSPQAPPVEAVLVDLLNEFDALPGDCALVLDDYHLIKARPIHDAVLFLLEHLPPRFHLVLATRTDPPFPLARLRARGELTELRVADLRFTADEAAAFLNEAMGLHLSADDIAALETRTEGWIAGLQLAALALQAPGRGDVSGFIASFTGSHQYVLDYLMEEVLQRQPEVLQTFLLQTSILEQLNGELCDALIEEGGQSGPSADTLQELEKANLFIVPLDEERRWYRYHHLFGDLLRGQLQRLYPHQIKPLHLRASAWYEARGFTTEAIHHAVAAEDGSRAARLVEAYGFAVLMHGEMLTVKGWLDSLPESERSTRPWLSIYLAWVLLLTGRTAEVEAQVQAAERALAAGPGPADGAFLRGHIATLRAYAASFMQDDVRAVAYAQEALAVLPAEEAQVRSIVNFVLGVASFIRTDLEGCIKAFMKAGELGMASGNIHMAVPALAAAASIQFTLGRVRSAELSYLELVKTTQERAGASTPLLSRVYSGLSTVYYEWNRLEEAKSYAAEGVMAGRRWGNTDVMATSYIATCAVRRARGDFEGARDAVEKVLQLMRSVTLSAGIPAQGIKTWIMTLLAQGNLAEVATWADAYSSPFAEASDFFCEAEYIILGRALLTLGRWDDAETLLSRLAHQTEAGGRMGRLIEILALQALLCQARGESVQGHTLLKRALLLAQPEGYARTFIDLGAPLVPLLQQVRAEGIAPAYVTALLEALGMQPAPASASMALLEPLSDREVEVLQMIAAGYTNDEIAGRLYVAVSTVKKHINHMYDKLGVRNRTQAVAKGREAGLLR